MTEPGRQDAILHTLEELVPIAVVIAAGCQRCAVSMVERALREGAAPPLIERTLAVVAHLRSLDCLAKAVGPEVTARMAAPLEAAKRALREGGRRTTVGQWEPSGGG